MPNEQDWFVTSCPQTAMGTSASTYRPNTSITIRHPATSRDASLPDVVVAEHDHTAHLLARQNTAGSSTKRGLDHKVEVSRHGNTSLFKEQRTGSLPFQSWRPFTPLEQVEIPQEQFLHSESCAARTTYSEDNGSQNRHGNDKDKVPPFVCPCVMAQTSTNGGESYLSFGRSARRKNTTGTHGQRKDMQLKHECEPEAQVFDRKTQYAAVI